MPLDLREEALDAVAKLNEDNIGRYEDYRPVATIKEEGAYNNKRDTTEMLVESGDHAKTVQTNFARTSPTGSSSVRESSASTEASVCTTSPLQR